MKKPRTAKKPPAPKVKPVNHPSDFVAPKGTVPATDPAGTVVSTIIPVKDVEKKPWYMRLFGSY